MSTTKLANSKKSWDGAIREAKERIERLETAILVFREMKSKGESWPGTQSSDHTAESCHSV